MKRMTLFLSALALTLAALTSEPAKAATCNPPACFASPGCCLDRQCDSWCGGFGLGRCGGNGSGGCCWCAG